MGKLGLFLLSISFAITAHAKTVLPTDGLISPDDLWGFAAALNNTYKIGDEWGKKPVTLETLEKESAGFRRMALATAKLGGGTAFYLGKYNGFHVMATNHHVLPQPNLCQSRTAEFPLLKLSFRCVKYFGTWDSIDLTLFAIKVDKAEDEATLDKVRKNFSFRTELSREQTLVTMGFGIADNPSRKLVANQDSDCKVFSDRNEYRLMADPDKLNPGPYKAWSFANGCDVSHGDSGSAMMDRKTGDVVGIIWTGKIPKDAKVQKSSYLNDLIKTPSEDIWTELSYSVPAPKMSDVLKVEVEKDTMDADTKATLKALLAD